MEKFQITDPSLKFWVSGSPSVNGNRIWALAIMEKMEKWPPFRQQPISVLPRSKPVHRIFFVVKQGIELACLSGI